MEFHHDIWLLWSPQGWGVFDAGSCPDPYGFPEYIYKKYEVPNKKYEGAINKLKKRMEKLVEEKVSPTYENYNSIFPELSDLLEE